MYTKKVITPFSAQLKPSRLLQWFNAVIHLLALASCWLTPLPLSLRLTLAILIVGDYWFNLKRQKQESRLIRHSETSGWQIIENDKVKKVQILPSTLVTVWLIFFHTKELTPILIAKDMMSEDEFRRLIVKLKISFDQDE